MGKKKSKSTYSYIIDESEVISMAKIMPQKLREIMRQVAEEDGLPTLAKCFSPAQTNEPLPSVEKENTSDE